MTQVLVDEGALSAASSLAAVVLPAPLLWDSDPARPLCSRHGADWAQPSLAKPRRGTHGACLHPQGLPGLQGITAWGAGRAEEALPSAEISTAGFPGSAMPVLPRRAEASAGGHGGWGVHHPRAEGNGGRLWAQPLVSAGARHLATEQSPKELIAPGGLERCPARGLRYGDARGRKLVTLGAPTPRPQIWKPRYCSALSG